MTFPSESGESAGPRTPLHDLEARILRALPGTYSAITALSAPDAPDRPARAWTAFVLHNRRVNVTWDGKEPGIFQVRAMNLHSVGAPTPKSPAVPSEGLSATEQLVLTELRAQPAVLPRRHVMLDLETLSTYKNAVIWSIGAQIFTFTGGQWTVLAEREFFIDAQSGIDAGGHVRANTLVWWMAQPEEARAKFAYSQDPKQAQSERDALQEFGRWIDENVGEAPRAVWGNGAASDIAQLESAYERQHLTVPWTFQDQRCYRTLSNQAPQIAAVTPFVGVRHDAIDDARHQTKVLIGIVQALGRTELL
ncbi:3'-5' exonuclease [Deinococcus soli (ex Cha et al. 2016)]|uniref:Uncharacterized protein n=2 Tax=Deinococcus soli (ex Cha et al. 2016) TaxID=1309411 RepID=A0ACC6KH41_9DEIO|nr:3'-5' exonuclease [Deinococcus soli (ex Cha et al. 2016)]MDR6218952.1 hypothetical protein [Deinococcus soli (ex Cha et al. 2016)]MDR6328749.1 hypothetical protein [Deinococcus soli (ex Cha et al. 2016)]MDR6751764.1 hypothetical protein [Deinococcus soli (ex Cha et al. 2016)]